MDMIYENPMILLPPFRVTSMVSIMAEVLDFNHKMMNTPAMWKYTRGSRVKVAILDTGTPNHVDLHPMGGKSFIYDVRPNEQRPYDDVDVAYALRYDGTARRIFVTQTLTK